MWGLEYALLFGVPNNKWELIDGRFRCAFPFLERRRAEAHFADWIETLCRWKGIDSPPAVKRRPRRWKAKVGRWVLELAPLPIDIRLPLDGDPFETFYGVFWRRELWEGQPAGREAGWEDVQRHADVQLNLWSLFGEVCARHGGAHSGRVDIALSDTAAVAPDQYLYRKPRAECMLGEDYFRGAPDLIAEVLSPATRAVDRGPRKDLYHRAGVPHLWLIDPEVEQVEIYELTGPEYRLAGVHGAGETFRPALFPDTPVSVDQLFQTQWKRYRNRLVQADPDPVPQWLGSPKKRLGLEYLLLLGHPERRYEIWGNRAPCVLPFGSAEEAHARFGHFLEDIGRWEGVQAPAPAALDDDVEQAEVGRFRLTRRGRYVHLDVAVDARKYRELLDVWRRREPWDWGED